MNAHGSSAPVSHHTSKLSIKGLSRVYNGAVRALDDVSLNVDHGEFLTILGPSGSGKTTLLRAIAGFEIPDSGQILMEGQEILGLTPAKRDIGMVFQSYALFPHMTVAENVWFPLRMRGKSRRAAADDVGRALELVELSDLADRTPAQLSGGQQQRVALARAIVFNPRLLLLDEPFGALDRQLREHLQLEVRRLTQRLGLTSIFITHDQEEALVLSDRIAVMNGGRILQIATPQALYEQPADSFVAGFIGESNMIDGRVISDSAGARVHLEGSDCSLALLGTHAATGPVKVFFRPSAVHLSSERSERADMPARVEDVIYLGESTKYEVDAGRGLKLIVREATGASARLWKRGESVFVGIDADQLQLIGGSQR